MEAFLGLLAKSTELLAILGPTLAAILTVPLMSLIKKYVKWIGSIPVWAKRLLVVLLATTLSWLGSVLDVALPGDISLFTGESIEALLTASIAFAVHAGDKLKKTS